MSIGLDDIYLMRNVNQCPIEVTFA